MADTEPILDVLPLDAATDGSSQRCRAVAEFSEDLGKCFCGCHDGLDANLFATVDAKYVARKCGKLFCVKRSLGEQVQDYMTREALTPTAMASLVRTTRQNINNVLAGAERPKCLPDLARVLGTTVDTLMAGRYVYGSKKSHAGAMEPQARYANPSPAWPFTRLTPDEWQRLGDLRHVVEDVAVTKARALLAELESAPSGQKRNLAA